jgi:hypothetical protein
MIVAFTNNLKAYSGDDIEITIRASQQKWNFKLTIIEI